MPTLTGILLGFGLIFLLGSETWQLPVKQVANCGNPSVPVSYHRRGKRIVGGKLAWQGKWPWIATLLFNNSQYCAGSIVAEKWLVTTSHCFHDNHSSLHPKDWTVKVGKFNLKKKESHEQIRKVKRIIRHPNYISMWDEYKLDVPDEYDVGLLELDKPISYTDYVKPICLQHGNQVSFSPGHMCTVAGWGHKYYNGKIQDKLNEVDVPLVSRKKCNLPKSYNGSVHERAICAGFDNGGRDACQYDSGGPLFCQKSTGQPWYLVGQVSWGEKCALPNKYGVYSNMKLLTPWVVKTIASFTTG